ncbi:MAG: ATP-binding protein [Rhodobacteraceae bacterium]|jgi:serine/threonine-protein kinase RsbW|nr:ATP-binding protein [Paracoccaceae bacterium]
MSANDRQAAGATGVCYCLDGSAVAVREGLSHMFDAPPLSGLSATARGTAEIVLAEVLNNIVEHAYGDDGGTIRLCLALGDEGLLCRIEDRGMPMPQGKLPPGTPPDPASAAEGGYGWHLIRVLARNLGYCRVAGVNCITFLLPLEG